MDKYFKPLNPKKHVNIQDDVRPTKKLKNALGGNTWNKRNNKKKSNITSNLKGLGVSYSQKFHDIRIRKKLSAKDFPDASKAPLEVFISNAEYVWDSQRGTIIGWYANEYKTNVPTYVQLTGYFPHFMIQFPNGFDKNNTITFTDCLEYGLRSFLAKNTSKQSRSSYSTFESDISKLHNFVLNGNQLIKYCKWIDANPLLDKKCVGIIHVLDIYLVHPKLVKIARDLIESPKIKRDDSIELDVIYEHLDFGKDFDAINADGEKDVDEKSAKSIRWCNDEIFDYVKNSQLFEADIDFIVRFLIDMRYSPCNWFQFATSTYKYINVGDSLRKTKCDLEIITNYGNMVLCADNNVRKVPDLIGLTFDEEWNNTGRLFPHHDFDDMIQIVFQLRTLRDTCKPVWVLMAYKEVIPNERDFDHVFYYENQVDYIADVLMFLRIIDADYWGHMNGNKFDIPFLVDRAEFLGIKDTKSLGRSLNKVLYINESTNKGFTKVSISIPGVINMDLLRRTQDDFPGIEDHSLSGLAKKFKLNMTKGELPYDMISNAQRTLAGRKRIAKYCKIDVILTDKLLSETLKAILVAIEFSRLDGVTINTIIDRAVSYKVEGAVRHECNRILPKDGKFIPTIKPTYKSVKKVKGEKYKGATVIRPLKGYYPDTVVATLDFTGMYPGIMMLYNLCYTTLIDHETVVSKAYVWKVHYWSTPIMKIIDGELVEIFDPTAPAFLLAHIRQGILPRLLAKWKAERKSVRTGLMEQLNEKIEIHKQNIIAELKQTLSKGEIEKIEASKDVKKEWGKYVINYIEQNRDNEICGLIQEHNRLSAYADAIKLNMNSTYGLTGFELSSFFCPEIASTVTAQGRNMLLKTKYLCEKIYNTKNGYAWDTRIIYGDTDSVFALLMKLANDPILGSVIGKLMAAHITTYFWEDWIDVPLPEGGFKKWRNPFWNITELTFEKVITNLIMVAGKNYAGLKHVVTEDCPTFMAKGIAQLKRKLPSSFKDILKTVSDFLCVDGDVKKAMDYASEKLIDLWKKKGSVPELTFIQRLSKPLNDYGINKKYIDKKTGEQKIRKGAESCAVKVAKDNWKAQIEMAKKEGIDIDSGIIRPPGAGDTIQFVYVKKYGLNPKKAKKSEKAMDPFLAMSTKAELDFGEYIRILEMQLCTLLRHPIDYIHPGEICIPETTDYFVMGEKGKSNEKEFVGKSSKYDLDSDEEGEDEELDEIELEELTPEQIKLRKKRDKELQKQLDKKVLRYLYEGKKRPGMVADIKHTNSIMYNFIVIQDKCSICEVETLTPEIKSLENSAICKTCASSNNGINIDRKQCASHSSLKTQLLQKIESQNTIWNTCEKCMDTTKEETLSCISLSCPNMKLRGHIDETVNNLKSRINKIDLSW